jgi:hypothetical protein
VCKKGGTVSARDVHFLRAEKKFCFFRLGQFFGSTSISLSQSFSVVLCHQVAPGLLRVLRKRLQRQLHYFGLQTTPTGLARAVRVLALVRERIISLGGDAGHVSEALELALRQISVAAFHVALAAVRERRCGAVTLGQLICCFRGETWL